VRRVRRELVERRIDRQPIPAPPRLAAARPGQDSPFLHVHLRQVK